MRTACTRRTRMGRKGKRKGEVEQHPETITAIHTGI